MYTSVSDDRLVNNEIKRGKWKEIVCGLHINVSELTYVFADNYNFEDALVDKLTFSFDSKIGDKGDTKK